MLRSISQRLRARLISVGLALALAVLAAGPAFAESAADYAIPGGWFFSQTGGGQGRGYAVRDAGTDSSGHTLAFWTEFQHLGGVPTLGYPIGQPYVAADGFTYQPFQRGVLQWRPEQGRAVLSNTFEILQSAGRDAWLYDARGIPRPISDDGSGGDYAKAVTTRLGWMTNDAIKAKFLANPNPQRITGWHPDRSIELYGLPMSQPEKHGPFISQRFQRIAFQLWVEDVPGMPAKGTVVGILGGSLLKEADQLPATSTAPVGPDDRSPAPTAPAVTPAPPPAPAPSGYPWHSTSVQGWPNCGTTYIRAFTRDGNGNGVNGMTLKSWNDWGNEYIASTSNRNGKDGYWDRVIGGGVKPGKWYVMLVDGAGNQASDVVTVNFTDSCEATGGNAQEVEVVFQPR